MTACAQTRVLENDQIRLTFSSGPNVHISSFFCKKTNREYVSHEPTVPLYQLVMVVNGELKDVVPGRGEITRVKNGQLKITVPHHDYGCSVVCTVSLPEKADRAQFELEIVSKGKSSKVGLVRYPGIGLKLPQGKRDIRVALPVADGLELVDPYRALNHGEERGYDYPGLASAQMMAMYDSEGGVVAYASDPNGHFKRLTVRRYGRSCLLLFENIVYHLSGRSIKLPYAIEVGSFKGDWRAGADMYKQWAVQQPWCKQRLNASRVPRSLKDPALYFGIVARDRNGHGAAKAVYESIPEVIRSWRDGLGMPVNSLVFGWEGQGMWITPDYFPPLGGYDRFRKMVKGLSVGGNCMVYLSGLQVTLSRNNRTLSKAFKASRSRTDRYRKMAIVGIDGKVMELGAGDEGQGVRYHLCPVVDASWKHLHDATGKLIDLGVRMIQIDQLCGGGSPICFSTRHGHPPVGGNDMYKSTYKHFAELQKRCHKSHSVLSLECPNELFLPVIDIFHTREYIFSYWPREKKGDRGIALFSYLYHEYGLGYGGDSAPIATNDEILDAAIYAQGLNLTAGRMPGVTDWFKRVRFSDAHVVQRSFMKQVADLYKTGAREFLLYGKRISIASPEPDRMSVSAKIDGRMRSLRVPLILRGAYQTEDGAVGVVVVNISDHQKSVKISMPGIAGSPRGTCVWPAKKSLKKDEVFQLSGRGILFYTYQGATQ